MDVNLAHTLAAVISMILTIIKMIVIASIITSWVGDASNQIVQTIQALSEPIYRPLRRFTQKLPGPLDWAPIAVFILIMIIEGMVVTPLAHYRGSSSPSSHSMGLDN